MAHSDYFLALYDGKGNLYSVMLSAELWNKGRTRLEPLIKKILDEFEPVEERPEPMGDWNTFIEYWDFKYPVNASVECGHCGARSNDWVHDPQKPFILKNATLGGLAVFKCKKCSSIIRKKHFKDHICYEFTAPSE